MNIGDTYTKVLKLDYFEMLRFLDTVDDINTTHRLSEDELKDASNFDTLTVQGMYAVCMFSGLLSHNFPNCLNMSRKATFIRPIYLSDTLTYSLKIKNINVVDNIITLKGNIRNSKGKVCVDVITEMKQL